MLGFSSVKSVAAALGVGLLLCVLPPNPVVAAHNTALTPTPAPQAPPTVSLGRTRVRGSWTPSGSAVFRAIPFAQPPVESLRWKPPQPTTLPAGIFRAIQPAPACLQAYVGWNRADAERSAENCLYLDIRTPRPSRKSRLPVFVWIHGGGNWAGSPGAVIDSGLADRGIVVVTIQYRLGVFGFLSHPQLTRESSHGASGNYALMDQIAALEWVKRNIAAFGGDPAQVTIAGHSAGGQDVALLLLSPRAKGLFARAIQHSGTAGFGVPPRTLAQNEAIGSAFAQVALAGGSHADSQIDALRAMEGRKLLDAQMLLESPTLTDNSFLFLQAVVDGWIVTAAPADLLRSGKAARVPVLIGNDAQEFTLYGGESAARHAVTQIFGSAASQALTSYGLQDGAQPADDPVLGSTAMQVAADATFRCPAEFSAETQAAAGQKVWRFQMEHAAPGEPRIDHGSELTFVFNNRPLNVAVDGVRPLLQSYWVNYIQHGDPNGPGLPQWPSYGGKRAYVAFTPAGPEARTALRASVCALLPRP
jgi:para-nitrobenzyl esterase